MPDATGCHGRDALSRRHFVRLGALGAGGAALAGARAPAHGQDLPPLERPPLGLVTYNVGRSMDLESLIKLAEASGLECLELRTTHAHGVEPTLTPDERRAVRERFAQTPVRLLSLGTTCEYQSPDPAVVRQNIETTRAFLQLAEDVGALGVKVRPNGLPEGVPVEQTLRQIAEALRECADFAGEHNAEVWLEVHGAGTSGLPHIRTIMETARHPRLGVTWNCNASDLTDGSIGRSLLLVRDWTRALHIHDLYSADYPWRELFALLVETRFDGWALCEMEESADPQRVMRYYRALYDALWSEAARAA